MKTILAIAILACMAAGPATKPTTAPAPSSAPSGSISVVDRASVAEALRRAVAELSAARYREASKACEEGLALFGKFVPPKLDDDDRINLYHIQAVALLRAKDIPAARRAMDRVCGATKANRSTRWNDAIIDLQIKNNSVRATAAFSMMLEAGPVDEEAADALGFSIDKIESDVAMRSRAPKLWNEYERYEVQLSPPSPGLHRWGSEWIDETKFAAIEKEKTETQRKRNRLTNSIRDRERILSSARQYAASEGAAYEESLARNARTASANGYNRAVANVRQCQEELDQAQRALQSAPKNPKPIFVPPAPTGMDPDLILKLK